ncbi:unnamed protein product [Thlaspi arvense]|uniref:F-box domain-containing protein n=1 Tax=Thlaspi arvense TaxID=13288 RepID=A0AAU9SWJ2_THLAR|nr:unnamed protein product [Thlaspi arvense]
MAKRRGRRSRRQRRINSHRKIHRIIEGADFINSMPDEILRHILSFTTMDLAIRTSVLSRRWRHVWCEVPCLNFYTAARGIDETLVSYRAPKITSFRVWMPDSVVTAPPQVDSWVEFAMSRSVEKLTLANCRFYHPETYRFPDSFYLSSSLTQLTVVAFYVIPSCAVSWSSLRNLTLSFCNLYDDSVANMLSGCPKLETLKLHHFAGLLERLDLTKSPSLATLEIMRGFRRSGAMEIVAPHIHSLTLECSEEPSTLVNVSSLTEANLHIRMPIICSKSSFLQMAASLQTMVLKMLAGLQNVERLTFGFGGTLLQIMTLAELHGVPFPTLKVQTLTLETMFTGSVIPGIARLLQNSPGLKNLIVHATYSGKIRDKYMDFYFLSLRVKCWRSNYYVFPTSEEINSMWGCNDATSKLLASFMELVLKNAKTLERMVVWLGGTDFDDDQWVEELRQMAGTLSHSNIVSIVIKRRN